MKDKKILKIVAITLIIVVVVSIVYYLFLRKDTNKEPNDLNPVIGDNSSFDYKIIHAVNNKNNYMISPLSIGYALNILELGSDNNTKSEIDNVLNGYFIPNYIISKNRISIANGLFIKDTFKSDINNDYVSLVKDNYDADVIYDAFNSPTVINNWVKEKTFGLITKITDNIDEDFYLGIVNAMAIDVEWISKFECNKTIRSEFTGYDNKVVSVPMMNSKNDISYIESDNATGIIKDYIPYDKDGNEDLLNSDNEHLELEFIGILPKGDINEYINNFDSNELNKLLNSKKNSDESTDIEVSIPRFSYEYNVDKFIDVLKNLGINDAFNEETADFSKISSDYQLYISNALHKSKIEFNENGTKAAAVTALILDYDTSYEKPKKTINVYFNKPFLYIIKEKNTDNIWFFGTVYEPTIWNESTKSCTE